MFYYNGDLFFFNMVTCVVFNLQEQDGKKLSQKKKEVESNRGDSKSFGLNLFRGQISADQVFPFPEGQNI